jgi:hypothetical protein
MTSTSAVLASREGAAVIAISEPVQGAPMPFSSQPVAGLTKNEAANRLAQDGSNVLPGGTPKTFLAIVLGVVTEPMFLMLLVAGGVYLALGDRATKVHEFVPPIGRLGKNGVAPSPVELRVVAAA